MNELELVIVVVYQKILQLLYVDELLEALAREMVKTFGEQLRAALAPGAAASMALQRISFDEVACARAEGGGACAGGGAWEPRVRRRAVLFVRACGARRRVRRGALLLLLRLVLLTTADQ